MGVYQSVTEPEIRVRQVKQVVPAPYVSLLKEKGVAKQLREQFNIPRKVVPTVVPDDFLDWVEFHFEWFEVETFN